MKLSSTLLCLVAAGLPAQVRVAAPQSLPTAPARVARPLLSLQPEVKVDLLPVGKTQGTFHLTGLVRKNGDVVLRWSNTEGEMPTEGVRVFRQKAGDTAWKDLTGRKPVGFLQGKAAEKRLDKLPPEEREKILAYPFGNVSIDPATRLRVRELPRTAPKGAPTRARDLSMEVSLVQFRSLRSQGRLNRNDLKMMHMRADMDDAMAEILGLTYTDDPGRGQWRYKIVVTLPEGGTAEAVCAKVFDTREATPVPQPGNLTAASGNGEVLLNWDEAPTDVVAGYNIYRSESPSGPWKLRVNADPVKRVELELEDPELSLRRAMGVQSAMVKMLRPLPESARTTQKVAEAHRAALAQVEQTANLPTLSPAASKALKDAVASGRVRPGGRQAPSAIFTDSIRSEGSTLQNEKTYYYKVTAVDIGGLEQPLDTAPVVAGVPKDLEAPKVPGRPHLKAEKLALGELRTAQLARLSDPRLFAAGLALKGKLPKVAEPLTPAQMAPSSASLTPQASPKALALGAPVLSGVAALASPTAGSLTLADARRQHLTRLAATVPVAGLQKLAQATVIRSNPDGTVPPAQLTWDPSPEGDLKGYEVHKAVGQGAFAKVAETTTPEWTDADLAPGQLYRYAIASMDKLGNVSARSPEGRVEVSDSSLPGRLAVPQLAGAVVKDLPTLVPVRRLLRPTDRIMAAGRLKAAKSALVVPKSSEALVADFQAPKALVTAKPAFTPKAAAGLTAGHAAVSPGAAKPKVGLAKDLTLAPTADLSAAKVLAAKPLMKAIARSINLMKLPRVPAKELHVTLTWGRPLQGFPMEYVVQQAPQQANLQLTKSPVFKLASTFKGFEAPIALKTIPLAAGAVAAQAKPTTLAAPAAMSTPGPDLKGMVVTTPALHTVTAKGLVATQGAGLRLSQARRDQLAKLVLAGGPGTFTRLNDAPVKAEQYGVTFPAEVAQYGGATFFFRVQAFTREFGRTVEGPLSAPIEVRLPDIVAPPSPLPGSVDLQEGAGGKLKVALGWTQDKVPDLKGILVERQELAYTLVEGEAKPGAPKGAPERLTPTPLNGASYSDAQPPAGYQRYTLRSVDHTGNESETFGHLDVLVPGEPMPGIPTDVAVAGATLTWKGGADTAGFTIWRSFTGADDDWQCISGILPASQTSFALPIEGALHLRVVGRSITGMHSTPSGVVIRTP